MDLILFGPPKGKGTNSSWWSLTTCCFIFVEFFFYTCLNTFVTMFIFNFVWCESFLLILFVKIPKLSSDKKRALNMESPENRQSSSHISAYFLPVKNISHLGFQDEETLSSILVLNFI